VIRLPTLRPTSGFDVADVGFGIKESSCAMRGFDTEAINAAVGVFPEVLDPLTTRSPS
jgi:hypothetical protein